MTNRAGGLEAKRRSHFHPNVLDWDVRGWWTDASIHKIPIRPGTSGDGGGACILQGAQELAWRIKVGTKVPVPVQAVGASCIPYLHD